MEGFINAKSMVTPGIAGGLVMFIANAFALAFDFEGYISYLVLALSFLVGVIVFADSKTSILQRVVLYVLNSLIIFSMATGTNSIGRNVSEKPEAEIEATIEPIALVQETERSIFLKVQQVTSDQTEKEKEVLKSAINTVSNSILLIQNDLVNNQKIYADPKYKMEKLIQINSSLKIINNSLERDTVVLDANQYQQRINEVQHNVETLQRTLLLERSRPATQQRFFKDWNN